MKVTNDVVWITCYCPAGPGPFVAMLLAMLTMWAGVAL